MNRLRFNNPVRCQSVCLKDGSKLNDCLVYILDFFVIVAIEGQEDAPTWYNADLIERLEGVQSIPDQKKNNNNIFF